MVTSQIKNFEELECWKEARSLVRMVYSISSSGSFTKDFGLKDQIRRSSISVMANVAEGFETYSDAEFIRFLGFSIRSASEVSSHLYAALDIGYISDKDFLEISNQAKKCSNYIKAFIRYIKSK
ncbi:MAG: four helix bundle protein [Candidatus Melainabacteria bacterium]|nr:four helix bundle protein [Candidatus Melainabacteria bacterium]